MKVVVRADASVAIGTGHVMRCLTLAEVLREHGAEVAFASRDLPGSCCGLVEECGFTLFHLPGDAEIDVNRDAGITAEYLSCCRPDWLVVDHYGIDAEWERQQRPFVGGIMVIDDLADRKHDCDILLDQNFYDDMESRYDGLIPPGSRLFPGPAYALLRSEFIAARRTLRERDGRVRRILLFFGGTDPTNETGKALAALRTMDRLDIAADVVVGAANPNVTLIRELCSHLPQVSFHLQVNNMAEFMAMADLAIGAGGTTTWERCYLGLPTLIIVVADNQLVSSRMAASAGMARFVGQSGDVTADTLASACYDMIDRPADLVQMTNRCLSFMEPRDCSLHDDILTCLRGNTHAS
jgi:UDP-2,4-diacetamido-2,4,6-trideoxy-beta-L-altropyranose hydrolase